MPPFAQVQAWKICRFLFFVTIFYKACCDTVNNDGCGQHALKPRILNGKNVRREDQPWMVSIVVTYAHNGSTLHTVHCGGTLITTRFVLTAARCLSRKNSLGSIVRVYFEAEKIEYPAKRIRVRDIIVHPNYDYKTRQHNVALLRLDKRIKKSSLSRPVCLMEKKSRLLKKNVTVMGYGPSHGAGRLRYVHDEIISFKKCSKTMSLLQNGPAFNNSTIICTAGHGRGSCLADGGGPVLIKERSRIIQVGVISYPLSCNSSMTAPSAHARVDYYFEWIKDVLGYFQKYHRQGKGDGKKKTATTPTRTQAPTRNTPATPPKPQLPPENGDVGHLPNYKEPS